MANASIHFSHTSMFLKLSKSSLLFHLPFGAIQSADQQSASPKTMKASASTTFRRKIKHAIAVINARQ